MTNRPDDAGPYARRPADYLRVPPASYGAGGGAGGGDSAVSPYDAKAGSRLPTLDGLVESAYVSVGTADPVTAILGDKRRVAGLGLGDLVEQVRRRIRLYEQHMDELEQSKIAATNAARNWLDLSGRVDAGRDPALLSIIQELEGQQREQRLSLWRDMSTLRQSLPTWLQDYLSASRRAAWLQPQARGYRGEDA